MRPKSSNSASEYLSKKFLYCESTYSISGNKVRLFDVSIQHLLTNESKYDILVSEVEVLYVGNFYFKHSAPFINGALI